MWRSAGGDIRKAIAPLRPFPVVEGRTFGKVCRPNSLLESDPVCRILWYTLGFAIEGRVDWQKGEFTAPSPIMNGWAAPSMIAREQSERFLFGRRVLVLLDEVQVRVEFSPTREGVIQGRGMAPSETSSFTMERKRCNHGACSCGATSAINTGNKVWRFCLVYTRFFENRLFLAGFLVTPIYL